MNDIHNDPNYDYDATSWQEDDKIIKYLFDHNYDYEGLTICELRELGEGPWGSWKVYGVLETAKELRQIEPANPLDYGAIYPWVASHQAPLMG